MPDRKQLVLFVSADAAAARAACDAFNDAAAQIGFPRAGAHGDVDLAAVEVVVPLDGTVPEGWTGRVEPWAGGDVKRAACGVLARLLGGQLVGEEAKPPPPPSQPKKVHTIKLSRETAGRKGKGVTVVSELPLTEEQLKELATKLKTACGSGGTAKDGRIEIQGDHRDKIAAELERLGYKVKRAGG